MGTNGERESAWQLIVYLLKAEEDTMTGKAIVRTERAHILTAAALRAIQFNILNQKIKAQMQ